MSAEIAGRVSGITMKAGEAIAVAGEIKDLAARSMGVVEEAGNAINETIGSGAQSESLQDMAHLAHVAFDELEKMQIKAEEVQSYLARLNEIGEEYIGRLLN
jgi:hypothetical protein